MFRTAVALMLSLTLLAAPALAADTPIANQATAAPGATSGTVMHGGYARTYIGHVPSAYQGQPTPLVLSLHGRYGTGADQRTLTHFDAIAEEFGFIVVYPDGIERSWNALHGTGGAQALGVDDVGFIGSLIDHLSMQFNVDPNRVYVAGMSNGGFMTHRLGCELSTRIAAIATVAGPTATALKPNCGPVHPPAVLMLHGTVDPIIPYGGGVSAGGASWLSVPDTATEWRLHNQCSALTTTTLKKGLVTCRTNNGCGGRVTLCTISLGGHTWPGGDQYAPVWLIGMTNRDVDASRMIWEFFAAHPRR